MEETGTRRFGSWQAPSQPALPPAEPEPDTTQLRLSAQECGRGVVVELSGEIDLVTAPQLVATLRTLQIPPPGLMVLLDLSGVDFCDVSGLNALLRSRRVLAERGALLSLAAPPRSLMRLLELTGLGEYLEVLPSLPATEICPTAGPVRGDVALSATGTGVRGARGPFRGPGPATAADGEPRPGGRSAAGPANDQLCRLAVS